MSTLWSVLNVATKTLLFIVNAIVTMHRFLTHTPSLFCPMNFIQEINYNELEYWNNLLTLFLETRFKFVTFRLDKQGLERNVWQRMIDLSGERFFMIDPISARTASEMLHKLTYQPISTSSVRVGANELDEIRAVTIHFDSICICGKGLLSVYIMINNGLDLWQYIL